MKFCLLGDTHFGCRNDLNLFHDHFNTFYDKMVQDLVDRNITHVFQLGDLFDRRKYINFHTLSKSKEYFFDRLKDTNIQLHTLVGNHDIFFRESLEVNSSSLVLGEYNNITVYQEPTTITFNNTSIDIIPWICKDNEKKILDFIRSSKSDICLGHFEIASFAMYKGVESHDGLPIDMFAKYERVFSGHYHTKSQRDNIMYVGTPYEMTWQDHNDPKGYHIFDTDTRDIGFVQNIHPIFVRIDYDDTKDLVDISSLDVANCFVKVVVTNKTDLYKFDQFMNRMYGRGCYEIKIVEDMSEFNDGEIGEEIDLEDTMDVLSNYIDSIDTDADKDRIKTFMKSLYVEAINTEVV
jgi:DNA repair exonuclease SbcCD nuclease subunit